MQGYTDGRSGCTPGTPRHLLLEASCRPRWLPIEQLKQVVALREGTLFARVQGFESEFGCEAQQCGDDDNRSVEQQGLRWPLIRVGVEVFGDTKQRLGVLHGTVGVTDFAVVLVARHVRASSAVA